MSVPTTADHPGKPAQRTWPACAGDTTDSRPSPPGPTRGPVQATTPGPAPTGTGTASPPTPSSNPRSTRPARPADPGHHPGARGTGTPWALARPDLGTAGPAFGGDPRHARSLGASRPRGCPTRADPGQPGSSGPASGGDLLHAR